ncbi:sigma-54 dependent transcriptional regulator [uncultured Mailhella sp.]|uniref:sigma-54-dependent transcriptional regulator n=1 Tax=uncultured Mailhella sp. TaxID=1981031 RepID=UPI0025E6F1F8|nr:sigma-54 dependent transcriptional regulator [uncultured Mailhella sp.]
MARILIVDDDETFSYVLKRACSRHHCEVMREASLRGAEQATQGSVFDVVFLDISLPDGNGLSLLPSLLDGDMHPEVIVVTGHDNPEWVEQALRTGAWDFIQKTDELDTILEALEQALLYHRNHRSAFSSAGRKRTLSRENIIGSSQAMQRCIDVLADCADSGVSVLLSGETGTGKEVFARAIHENSARRHGPFVVVDCAALPEDIAESLLFGHMRGAFTGAVTREMGLVADADGGTLFLDEIGELPLSLQKVFLRMLQEKRVRPLGSRKEVSCDFRLVAATNRNLEAMVTEGTFRQDLFYRIQSVHITLPPLRERAGDVMLLAEHFRDLFSRRHALPEKNFSAGTVSALKAYDWPGNVREMSAVMERAVLSSGREDTIFPQHLSTAVRIRAASVRMRKAVSEEQREDRRPSLLSYAEFRENVWHREEGRYLAGVLEHTGGNIAEACVVTGLSRSRLYALLKEHGLTGSS